MMKDYPGLSHLYEEYNNSLKPILALVEATLEAHPVAILNEIRAFNDHIARCYLPTKDDVFIKDNIDKARGHIKRAMLDCFKNLNIYYFEKVEEFDRRYKKVDLTWVNDGNFFKEYYELKQKAINMVHEAKKNETLDSEKSFELFEKGYLAYEELYKHITVNIYNTERVKKRFLKQIGQGVGWALIWIIIGWALTKFAFDPLTDWSKAKVKERHANTSLSTTKVNESNSLSLKK